MNKITELIEECNEAITFYTNHLNKLKSFVDIIGESRTLLREINPKIKLDEFEEIEQFSNLNALLSITTIDLSVVTKNLFEANTDWERIFFIKHAFLIIFESLKKLRPTSGTPYIEQRLFSKYKSIVPEYKLCLNQIDEFKRRPEFKKVENTRNYVAGHIDKNFKKYYDTVSSLDSQEASALIRDFILIINKMIKVTQLYSSTALKNTQNETKQGDKRIKSLIEQLKQGEARK
jgi:hypothetical protein